MLTKFGGSALIICIHTSTSSLTCTLFILCLLFVRHNNGDFFGVTNFTYQVCDTLKVCSQGTVIVDVINVNDPPVLSLGTLSIRR